MCQHIDVIQTGQAGWMVLILPWKMMRFSERSALVTVLPVVNTQQRFLLGIYIEIIAVFTLILRYIFFGDFTQSSFRHNKFNDILKLLGQIFYVDDILINCAITYITFSNFTQYLWTLGKWFSTSVDDKSV